MFSEIYFLSSKLNIPGNFVSIFSITFCSNFLPRLISFFITYSNVSSVIILFNSSLSASPSVFPNLFKTPLISFSLAFNTLRYCLTIKAGASLNNKEGILFITLLITAGSFTIPFNNLPGPFPIAAVPAVTTLITPPTAIPKISKS